MGLILATLLLAGQPAVRQPVKHDVVVDGHHFAVWQKRGAQPRAAILLLHGRTWSSLPNFDLQVAGEKRSFMDALADAGFDVFALDMRGYGATPRDATAWLTPDRAIGEAKFSGATVDVIALAAVRATREATVARGRDSLPAIIGTPFDGQTVGRETFDGASEVASFPGDLPEDPAALLARDGFRGLTAQPSDTDFRFLRFRPPATEPGASGAPTLPHIGWNPLLACRDHPVLDGVPADAPAYFVHSYAPAPADREVVVAETEHGGRFASLVASERIVGFQFHPERSGIDGLRLLANTLRLIAADAASVGRAATPATPASAVRLHHR